MGHIENAKKEKATRGKEKDLTDWNCTKVKENKVGTWIRNCTRTEREREADIARRRT